MLDLQNRRMLKKLAASVLIILAATGAHFLGFLRSTPEGIQRLVATSFAAEFSAVFFYFVALATLGARLATYFIAAFISSWGLWSRCFKGPDTVIEQRRFIRAARSGHRLFEWPVAAMAPVVLVFLYAHAGDLWWLLWILVALVLMAPLTMPLVALNPTRYIARIRRRGLRRRRLESGLEVLLVLSGVFLALSYFLGQARFAKLAGAPTMSIRGAEYVGDAVVLAQSGDELLLLERVEGHMRFIFIRKGTLFYETVPPKSPHFKELRIPSTP